MYYYMGNKNVFATFCSVYHCIYFGIITCSYKMLQWRLRFCQFSFNCSYKIRLLVALYVK